LADGPGRLKTKRINSILLATGEFRQGAIDHDGEGQRIAVTEKENDRATFSMATPTGETDDSL
jgi:hypothetical protein